MPDEHRLKAVLFRTERWLGLVDDAARSVERSTVAVERSRRLLEEARGQAGAPKDRP